MRFHDRKAYRRLAEIRIVRFYRRKACLRLVELSVPFDHSKASKKLGKVRRFPSHYSKACR